MIPSEEANRILTGLIFLGVKAERLRSSYQSLQGNVDDPDDERLAAALRRMQAACAEAANLKPEQFRRQDAHSTIDALLAPALLDLFAAAYSNNMELGSAILRELNRKHSIVKANVTSQNL